MSSHSLEFLDDVPSVSDDASYDSDAEELMLAQQEWEESIHQLQLLLTLLVMPLLGKWLGRRWSQWAYARYAKYGLTWSFLFGQPSLQTRPR